MNSGASDLVGHTVSYTLMRKEIKAQGLAKHLGVDRTLVSKWKNGERSVSCDLLPGMAEYMDEPEILKSRMKSCPVFLALKQQRENKKAPVAQVL